MELLFVHDFPVEHFKENDSYYSSGFPYSLWKRYLTQFDTVNVSCRIKTIDTIEGKSKSSGENVNFLPIRSYTNALSLIKNNKKIKEELLVGIRQSEAVLIRIPSVLGFIAAELCIKENKPYMVEVVGAGFDAYWNFGTLTGKLLAFPMEFAQKRAAKNSSVANYVTKRYLEKKYPTKGVTFSGLTDVSLFNSRTQPNPDFTDNKIIIGLIGSTYTKYKGHDLALESLHELKKSGYNIELQLVGQGLSNGVKELINKYDLQDNVNYLGVIYDRTFLNNWFQNIHIYIQPSRTEGLCRSIMEAISLNVVTLASNVGGNVEIVDKNFTFSSLNSVELTELIKTVIGNEEIRKENVLNNNNMLKQFDFDNIAHKREKTFIVYKNLLGGEE